MSFRVLILVLSGSALVLSSPVVKGPIRSNKTNELPGDVPHQSTDATSPCQKLDELRNNIRSVTKTIRDLQQKSLKESDEFILLENVAQLLSKYGELSSKNKALKKEIESSQNRGCKKAPILVNPELKSTLEKIETVRGEIIKVLKSYLLPAMLDNSISSKKRRDISEKRNPNEFRTHLKDLDQKLSKLVKDLRHKRYRSIGDA